MKLFTKRPKWGNKECYYKGIKFASKKEMQRCIFLEGKQNDGEISNLQTQVRVELVPAVYKTETVQLKTKTKERNVCVQRAIYYVADFVYERNGELVYEDVKGSQKTLTKVYALKKKMMLALKGIDVEEIYDPCSWTQHKPQR